MILQCDGNITLKADESENRQTISTVITSNRPDEPSYQNKELKYQKRNLLTIKRSNKVVEASRLPVVINLNPRSLYNKASEFSTLIEQTEAGVCCISETWDRSHIPGGALYQI